MITIRRKNSLLPFFPAFLSGTLLFLIFPDFDLNFLAWVALIPLFYAISDSSPQESFLRGWTTGGVYFLGTIYWVTISMNTYGKIPLLVSYLLLLLLVSYLGAYVGAFAFLLSLIRRRSSLPLLIVAPVLWTALEYARGVLLTGFPWALLGYSQYRLLPLIQIADVTGVYGVSFLIVLINASLFESLVGPILTEKKGLHPLRGVLTGMTALTVVLLYGNWRLTLLSREDPLKQVRVAVAQGNIDQEQKWDEAFRRETLERYKKLTALATEEGAELVVWPESATPFFFQQERRYQEEIARFLKEEKVSLLFGSPALKGVTNGRPLLLNSAYLLSQEGQILSRYDKIHLVPFGEYVPLSPLFGFLNKMVEGIGDFVPGDQYTVMESPHGRVGVIICFEVIFPDLVRRFVRNGAEFMATITNDAWFGRSSAPFQHFSMVVFRAIENRVPFVRAANTGISGVINPYGRIKSMSDIFRETYLVEEISLHRERSFYTRYGDFFAYLCGIISVALLSPPVLGKRERA